MSANTHRRYSLSEIDRMRNALRGMFPRGFYSPEAVAAQAEDQLRTYMLNGTEPEELERAQELHQEQERLSRAVAVEQLKAEGRWQVT